MVGDGMQDLQNLSLLMIWHSSRAVAGVLITAHLSVLKRPLVEAPTFISGDYPLTVVIIASLLVMYTKAASAINRYSVNTIKMLLLISILVSGKEELLSKTAGAQISRIKSTKRLTHTIPETNLWPSQGSVQARAKDTHSPSLMRLGLVTMSTQSKVTNASKPKERQSEMQRSKTISSPRLPSMVGLTMEMANAQKPTERQRRHGTTMASHCHSTDDSTGNPPTRAKYDVETDPEP